MSRIHSISDGNITDIVSRINSIYHSDGAITLGKKSAKFIRREIYNQYWNHRYFGSGTSILDEDWDNILLLDACRYDEFLRVAPFNHDLIERRITVGSNTPQFLSRTFSDVELHDTVYITANPQPVKFQFESENNIFHDMISLLDEWDAETQTVRPETVRKAAVDISNEYPNKKLIIHFLQPHAPFLGSTAAEIRRSTGKTIGGFNPGREYTESESKEVESASYEDIIAQGISKEKIRKAYRETLSIVIEECEILLDSLHGKTAITSDHGELLGERVFPFGRPRYEHPGIRTAELCIVPWIEFDKGNRKRIRAESPSMNLSDDKKTVDSRLRSLGYK